MNIELVNPIPELEEKYKEEVQAFIELKLITLEEWNTRFKNYRDSAGYSMIHYLTCAINNVNSFVTINPIMLENRKELIERFNVQIMTLQEMMEFKNEEE